MTNKQLFLGCEPWDSWLDPAPKKLFEKGFYQNKFQNKILGNYQLITHVPYHGPVEAAYAPCLWLDPVRQQLCTPAPVYTMYSPCI
jgi:hypothetical protein